ncbi:MAG TPA: LuxR C-terminal-related transcriptional regulator, partial [Chloroflexota bacterium]
MRDDRPGDGSQEPAAGTGDFAPGGTVTPFPGTARVRPRAARPGRAPQASFRLAERQHNLPLQLTNFVGREKALAEAGRLLATTRLLTLTGAPGVGKTRLALQLADEVREAYAQGVWLVELAPLADPALVPQAVAAVLGVHEHPGRPLVDTLNDALREQQTLLLLDNCEHLVAACATLADRLLRACPNLEILATSREALGVAGETAWWVPSLGVPADDPPASAAGVTALSQCEAVRLFVERARAAVPTFTLTERNAGAVGQVCRRLDGIPLALELAAARVRALRVEQVAQRLDDRFRLLTAGSRAALPRQQTLRAAVDWSHALLPEPERVLLRRLAVFAGGWTLEAAEAVCAGNGLMAEEVLELLVQLVNKSLVVAEEHGEERRYRLLETLREYGAEKLREAGEETALRDRHLAWFVALPRRAYASAWGPEQVEWFSRLQTEQDNLRTAMEWTKLVPERAEGAAPETVEAALDLGRTLWRFWQVRGYMNEAREWLTAALARVPAPTAARTNALWAVGYLAMMQGDFAAVPPLLEEGLVLAQQAGDAFGTTNSLSLLGALAMIAGDLERAAALMEASLPPLGEVSDDTDRYVATIMSVYWRVELARHQGDYGRAIALLEEGLALVRDRGDIWSNAVGLSVFGRLVWLQGDYGRATALQQESLAQFRELHTTWGMVDCMDGLAWVANARRRAVPAARLFGAAEALRERIGATPWPIWLAEHERNVAATRARLGEEAFAAAWAAGRALPIDAVIAEALGEDEPTPAPAAPPERASSATPATQLSEREREVAALIALGCTNRQIAEQLVISQWTADTHVRHILTKL